MAARPLIPGIIAVSGKLEGCYPTTSPDLCIEIPSPDDSLSKALDRALRYLLGAPAASGSSIPKSVLRRTLSPESGNQPIWVPPSGELQIDERVITIHALFAEIDQRLNLTDETA